MHDVGKPRTRRFVGDGTVTFHHHDVVGAKLTRKRMKALRFSNDEIDAVSQLVELHLRFHGYGSGEWTDSAVRRYVRDAGDQLERLHVLTRADCTTRNQRKADRLRRTYDELEERIARLSEEEELASIRPDLDGHRIMEILGVGPGREVGEAYRSCSSCGMDHGPMSEDDADRRAPRVVGGPHPTLTCRTSRGRDAVGHSRVVSGHDDDAHARPARGHHRDRRSARRGLVPGHRRDGWPRGATSVKTVGVGAAVEKGHQVLQHQPPRPAGVRPTQSMVVRFEPHTDFAFRIKENYTVW